MDVYLDMILAKYKKMEAEHKKNNIENCFKLFGEISNLRFKYSDLQSELLNELASHAVSLHNEINNAKGGQDGKSSKETS